MKHYKSKFKEDSLFPDKHSISYIDEYEIDAAADNIIKQTLEYLTSLTLAKASKLQISSGVAKTAEDYNEVSSTIRSALITELLSKVDKLNLQQELTNELL